MTFRPRSANHIPPYKVDSSDDVLILNSSEGNDIQVVGESQTTQRMENSPIQISRQMLDEMNDLGRYVYFPFLFVTKPPRVPFSARHARMGISGQGAPARNHRVDQTIEIDDEDDYSIGENNRRNNYLSSDSDVETLQ